MKRRLNFMAISVVCCIFGFSSLSFGGGITIRFAACRTAGLEETAKLLPEFEKETGIKVIFDWMSWDDTIKKFTIDCVTGTKSYATARFEPVWMTRIAEELEPLEKYCKEAAGYNLGDHAFPVLETCKWKGVLRALPYDNCVDLLYYRTDVLKKYGLDVPQTFEEFLEAVKKVHNPPELYGQVYQGQRGVAVESAIYPYMWGFGADYFGDYSMCPTLNTPEFAEAVNYMKKLIPYSPPGILSHNWDDCARLFATGKVAFAQVYTDYVVSLLDPTDSVIIGKWNLTFFPGKQLPSGRIRTVNGLSPIIIPMNADLTPEEKKAAFKFISWMTGAEMQFRFTKAKAIGPTRYSVATDPRITNDPELFYVLTMVNALDTGRPRIMLPEGPVLIDSLGLRLSQALTGKLTAEEALELAQKEWVKIMKEAGYNF